MDLPAPPSLVTLKHHGRKVDAAVQTSKMGLIFVFDRETGKPLFPIEERTVSVEGAGIGEKLSPTQPFPKLPKPFRSEEHTSELQSLMRNSYAVFCLKKKKLKVIHEAQTH